MQSVKYYIHALKLDMLLFKWRSSFLLSVHMRSACVSHTYYSQVDTKVLIGEFQRLDYSGLSDSASARPGIVPTLCLGHLPQLMQHTHQRHVSLHRHKRSHSRSDDIWKYILKCYLGGEACLPLYLRSSQTKYFTTVRKAHEEYELNTISWLSKQSKAR